MTSPEEEICEHKEALIKSAIPYPEDYICRACHPSTTPSNWEESKDFRNLTNDLEPDFVEKLISFFSQTLTREREEMNQEYEEALKLGQAVVREAERARLLALIEEYFWKDGATKWTSHVCVMRHNKDLATLKSKLMEG